MIIKVRRRSKRGPEQIIYNEETGQIQEEVLVICKYCGIDVNCLYPK